MQLEMCWNCLLIISDFIWHVRFEPDLTWFQNLENALRFDKLQCLFHFLANLARSIRKKYVTSDCQLLARRLKILPHFLNFQKKRLFWKFELKTTTWFYLKRSLLPWPTIFSHVDQLRHTGRTWHQNHAFTLGRFEAWWQRPFTAKCSR